jgi:hypothetical protein
VAAAPSEEEIRKKLLLLSAEQAMSAGNYSEALQYGNQVLSLEPTNQFAMQIKDSAQKQLDEQKKMWILIGVACVIFLILIGVLIVTLIKRSRSGGGEVQIDLPPNSSSVDEGKTIKLIRPPKDTMKLLPGKFVVMKGEDSKKEIRFQIPKDAVTKEFTFGRQNIPDQNPYGHIQIKDETRTVSNIQAKLYCTDKGYTLINISGVNPTEVSGRELKVNESVDLKDGDLIVMGLVEFKYEAK